MDFMFWIGVRLLFLGFWLLVYVCFLINLCLDLFLFCCLRFVICCLYIVCFITCLGVFCWLWVYLLWWVGLFACGFCFEFVSGCLLFGFACLVILLFKWVVFGGDLPDCCNLLFRVWLLCFFLTFVFVDVYVQFWLCLLFIALCFGFVL